MFSLLNPAIATAAPRTLGLPADALAKLLGRTEPPVNQNDEIAVTGNPQPRSELDDRIIRGGPLRMGSVGGNILGALGDAFLTQGGRDPQYAPRLQRARAAEALQDYRTDPEGAIDRYLQVDPTGAAELFNQTRDNNRADSQLANQTMGANDEYEANTHTRAGALIGAATDEPTYQRVRQRYYSYYQQRGVEPLMELPETYAEAQRMSTQRAFIDSEEQAKLDSQRDYREQVLGQQRINEQGRNARGEANRIAADRRAAASRDVRVSEGNANRDVRRETARGARGRARPSNVRIVRLPNGQIDDRQ
jgi:hypothetical protein